MVSLWPWKGEDNSPASFEKALSTLSTKISKSKTQLESLRQRSRRFKALWTLYTSFAYLLCAIILFLVVGWQNWSALEYTAIAGSPFAIYLVRTGIATYYNFRVDTVTQRLEDQQAERAKTIDKLKAATKYNTTQELLEKYGGAPSKPKKEISTSTPTKSQKSAQNQAPGRTSMGPPPPTANIGRHNQMPSQPSTPQPVSRSSSYTISAPSPSMSQVPHAQAEFAPNAFAAPPQYATRGEMSFGGHWYDRVLDLLLGEDETSPKNRIILICQKCRLVNGQAPPGTKNLIELGKWKCVGCGAMNGEEDEAVKAVKEMKELINRQEKPEPGSEEKGPDNAASTSTVKSEANDEIVGDEVKDESEGDTVEVSKLKRGRPKVSRKKA